VPTSPAPDSRSDQQLVTRCNQGDTAAFEIIYYRYRDWVIHLAARFTGDHTDALDVMQETFSYLLRKFPGFTLTSSLTTFLYPVVKNTAIRIRQKRRRTIFSEALPENPAAIELGGADDGLGDLRVALSRLSDAHREVVLMRFVDDMSLEAIAKTLAIPIGTVKSRLHHAINGIRNDPQALRYFQE
jgi:RNA polymerase sigma-70 factor, ECF subfamily